MILDHGHFQVNPDTARDLFSRSVVRVELEISTYCNRTCSYCPNVIADRRSQNVKMSDALYTSILTQLSSIEWAGGLRFHRYNEPLSDREYLISRLREAREVLPKASLDLYSNGDYLDRDYLHELYVAGCRKMFVTFHTERYDGEQSVNDLEKRVAKLGYPYSLQKDGDFAMRAVVKVAPDMIFHYTVRDFFGVKDGVVNHLDRGQALGSHAAIQRTAPCTMPFVELQVETDGTLLPCCNIRTDVPGHKDCALGQLTPDSDIFLAWTNAEYVKWRRGLMSYEPKDAPCSTCTYDQIPDNPVYRGIIANFMGG